MNGDAQVRVKEAEALRLVSARDYPAAIEQLTGLLQELHESSSRYEDWVRALATVADQAERPQIAGPCWEYLLDWERAAGAHHRARKHAAAARCREHSGAAADAARIFEGIDAYVHAAVAWERAERWPQAIAAWERAVRRFGDPADRYERALALMNLGLALHHQQDLRWRGRLSESIVLLEEEADEAERGHQQARALACFNALVEMGRQTGSHENLAEGYLNCIRLMRERDQRLFVLQYHHDFAEASLAMDEPQAAAEVLREASAYCRRKGLLYGGSFQQRAAAAFEEAAVQHREVGAPPELAENAYLAALDCYNRVGDLRKVRQTYEALSRLSLPSSRVERYRALHDETTEEGVVRDAWPFRGYFSRDAAYPRTWRSDLLRRDEARDLLGPVSAAVGNLRLWDVVRRRCLLIVLRVAEDPGRLEREAAVQDLAAELGRLGAPVALEPLARLHERGTPEVRRVVAASLRFLPFRESLELVGACLEDPSPEVQAAALGAMRFLVFPGALAPLLRLYRQHPEDAVRREVILALGRTAGLSHPSSRDAMDFLLHTLREGADGEVLTALRTAIAANAGNDDLPLLERHALAEPPGPTRVFLDRIIVQVETRKMTMPLGV
ncbi:MAG: HEAT repeat domain-containing protein [Deltaproteobacteria bacterium]|nr:HEAT repeat domain-containing protein [Deltaproteobacteria bacterium]